VVRAAGRRPEVLFIGVDADPTRMRRASQHAPANAIFVVAAAESLPAELDAAVSELTVHFPWGSLLRGLVAPSPTVLDSLGRVLRPGATLTALLSIGDRDGGTPLGAGSIDRAA
jgi:16S rRNA (adenine(1408)-N(1))-methyltransferase